MKYKCRLEPCKQSFTTKLSRNIHEKTAHNLNFSGDLKEQLQDKNRKNINIGLRNQIDQKVDGIFGYNNTFGTVLFFVFMTGVIYISDRYSKNIKRC